MASLFSAILPDHLKEKLGMRTSKERDKSGMFLLKLPIQGSKLRDMANCHWRQRPIN